MARKARCDFSKENNKLCELMTLIDGVWICEKVMMETMFFCECPAFCEVGDKICNKLQYGKNKKIEKWLKLDPENKVFKLLEKQHNHHVVTMSREQICTYGSLLQYLNELKVCPE